VRAWGHAPVIFGSVFVFNAFMTADFPFSVNGLQQFHSRLTADN
jgi:hypothetical protein